MSVMRLSGELVWEVCCGFACPGFLSDRLSGLDKMITSRQSQPSSEATMVSVRCVSQSSRYIVPETSSQVSCFHTHCIASQLPCSILHRSYSDHELDYSRPCNSFSPDDLAPYIYFGGLTAQIPELLGLADQFEAAQMKQGPYIIFYRSLEQGTWSQLRKALPFTYQGAFQSDCTLDWDDTLRRLNINAGITEYDRDQVVYAMQHGPHPRVVYKSVHLNAISTRSYD